MHTTIDYSKSPAPKFDAIEHIKEWLGVERWNKLMPEMSKITNPEQFAFYCDIAGIKGFPVLAWYDLIHGDGAYERNWPKDEEA